jgi:pimeloyl-ACP methyl ester carboxylesterase
MPTFVLLPGLHGTDDLHADLAHALAPQGRAVAVGYPVDRALGYPELVAQLLADWPVAGDVVLVAESFSGPVALMLAAQRPRGLRAVVLSATFACNPSPWLRPLRPLLPLLSHRFLPPAVAAALMLGRDATPAWRATIARILARVSDTALRARAAAAFDVDVRALIPTIDVPLLYLRGRRDRLIASRHGDEIVALARDGRLVEIDAPHLVLQVAAREAAAAIDDFLRWRR